MQLNVINNTKLIHFNGAAVVTYFKIYTRNDACNEFVHEKCVWVGRICDKDINAVCVTKCAYKM